MAILTYFVENDAQSGKRNAAFPKLGNKKVTSTDGYGRLKRRLKKRGREEEMKINTKVRKKKRRKEGEI